LKSEKLSQYQANITELKFKKPFPKRNPNELHNPESSASKRQKHSKTGNQMGPVPTIAEQ
jgi:hypothetical protein